MNIRTLVFASIVAGSTFASESATVSRGNDTEAEPGLLRLNSFNESDVVRLDGEVIDAAGLRRAKFELLIAPGDYEVVIARADGHGCTQRITVRSNSVAVPSCDRRVRTSAYRIGSLASKR